MSQEIDQLVTLLAKLPGLGKRSAQRAVLHLIQNKENHMLPLAEHIVKTAENTKICENCGNIDTHSPCHICENEKRDKTQICVVEEVSDVWAIERSSIFRGTYHVLGGTLSAIDGRGPNELNIEKLIERASSPEMDEIILATSATVEGQTTAHYITERLEGKNLRISQIAHGIPMGGELDYLDDGTLATALKARRAF